MPDEPVFDAAALRAARERAGLTQHQLARLVDVAGGERVSRWELGLSVPRPQMVKRLAQALQVDPGQLVPEVAGSMPTLRALRVRAGLSAQQVASDVHVSVATYLRWESGQVQRLPGTAFSALAKALGLTPSEVRRAPRTPRQR